MSKASVGLSLLQSPVRVEAALWRRLRLERDERCRERLFDRYVEFARMLARREFRRRPPNGMQRADFEQLAFSGLLEAIDRYDPLIGAPFDAFARRRIKGAIADGAAKSSEAAARFDARARVERERLRSLLPASHHAADPLTDLADLAIALTIGALAASANLQGHASGSGPLDAYETVGWRDLQVRLLAEIEELPQKERTVIRQHYVNDQPFHQIATLLGLSKGRIAQIHKAALARLRARLHRET